MSKMEIPFKDFLYRKETDGFKCGIYQSLPWTHNDFLNEYVVTKNRKSVRLVVRLYNQAPPILLNKGKYKGTNFHGWSIYYHTSQSRSLKNVGHSFLDATDIWAEVCLDLEKAKPNTLSLDIIFKHLKEKWHTVFEKETNDE